MSGRRITVIAIALAMLGGALVTVAPSAFAEESTDDPSADNHCRWWYNHRTYLRWVSPDPVQAGEPFNVRTYMESEGYRTNHFTAYLKGPDGEFHGPIYHHHDRCTRHTHTFSGEAPLKPGTYEVWALGSQYYDPSPDRFQSRDITTLEITPPPIDVDRDTPSEADLGEAFTSELTVTNEGNSVIEGFTLTEDLADNVDLVRGGDTWTDDSVSWYLGDLHAGDSVTVSYDATASGLGTSSFAAYGQMMGFQWQIGDGQGFTVLAPDIDTSRELDDTVNSGELTRVNVTFTNTGTAAAHDVTLADSFDSAYTPVPSNVTADASADTNGLEDGAVSAQAPSASATLGFDYGEPAADQHEDPFTVKGEDETTLTWSLDTLGVGESVTVSYLVQAPVHVPTADQPDAPDQPEPPEEPPEPPEEPPEAPAPEEPSPEDRVNENNGTYVFTASADYETSAGLALDASGDGGEQTVRALQWTQVDEPEPPAEPPEDLLPEDLPGDDVPSGEDVPGGDNAEETCREHATDRTCDFLTTLLGI